MATPSLMTGPLQPGAPRVASSQPSPIRPPCAAPVASARPSPAGAAPSISDAAPRATTSAAAPPVCANGRSGGRGGAAAAESNGALSSTIVRDLDAEGGQTRVEGPSPLRPELSYRVLP